MIWKGEKDMNKYPLIGGSICAVVLLVLASLTNVVGYQTGMTNTQMCEKGLRDDNDTTPPATTISFNPPIPNGLNGWYVSNVLVTLNATDNESGVNRTYCSLLPPGKVYTEPILVSQDGVYFIYYLSVDNAGNVELPKCAAIKIDKTQPTIITNYTWGGNFWDGYWICVTCTYFDTMSGIGRVEFYFNGVLELTVTGTVPTYVWNFSYAPLPNVIIKVIAYDNAGWNSSAELTNTYTIQSQDRFTHSLILRHQIINLFPALREVNQ